MNVEITIKNYRCFADTNPVRIHIQNGFTSFVGVNNSGKSTILKFFYEFRSLLLQLQHNKGLAEAISGPVELTIPSVKLRADIFYNGNSRDIELIFSFPPDQHEQQLNVQPSSISEIGISVLRQNYSWKVKWIKVEGELLSGQITVKENDLLKDGVAVANLAPLYSAFSQLGYNIYIGPFRNSMNAHMATDSDSDMLVAQSFITKWRQDKTGDSKQQNELIFKVTQDIKRIFAFNDLEINVFHDGSELQVFLEGKSYRLSELGSGLAQFIIIFGNAAFRHLSLILIDEPELNLHPKLQLDFLTSLASYAKCGILFATHSIGLARTSSERIYTVHKFSDGSREVTELDAIPRLSEFLGELSFSGYRELGFDILLLVEGPTETKTMQQFLRKLKKDHIVMIMPLGGNSLINGTSTTEAQLEEIKRITTNVFILIDSERKAETDPIPPHRVAFQMLCQKAEFQCHILQLRAIENYFTERAIQSIFGSKYSALEPYQALETASFGWAKADNWRIAEEMTEAELQVTDLWTFLKSIEPNLS